MKNLIAQSKYYKLSKNQKSKICNGAGAANSWRSQFIPNTLYGLNCIEAFNIHDFDYHTGISPLDKFTADLFMLINLVLLIVSEGGWLQTLRIYRAVTYFIAVHFKGADAFYLQSKGNLKFKNTEGENEKIFYSIRDHITKRMQSSTKILQKD